MNQYLIPLNDDMYESIDDFILEQCTYYGDENNCKSYLKYFSFELGFNIGSIYSAEINIFRVKTHVRYDSKTVK